MSVEGIRAQTAYARPVVYVPLSQNQKAAGAQGAVLAKAPLSPNVGRDHQSLAPFVLPVQARPSSVSSAFRGRPSFLGRLRAASQYGSSAALWHRQNGLGLLAGLGEFKAEQQALLFLGVLRNVLASQAAYRSSTGRDSYASQPSSIDQIGLISQQHVIESAKAEIAAYLAEAVGIDLSNLSPTGLMDELVGGLLGETGAASFVLGQAASADDDALSLGSSALGEAGSTLGEVLGPVGAAYSVYGLIDNWGKSSPQIGAIQGASTGAYIGTQICPGIGTLIGGALGGLVGGLLGSIKTGKSKEQQMRDAMRDHLEKLDIVDNKHNVELANGEKYHIGYDGGHTYLNVDGTKRHAYDVDFSNPLAAETVGWVQPLAAVLTGGHKDLKVSCTGYLANAALSNASDYETARQNVLSVFSKIGVSGEQVIGALVELYKAEKLTQEELVAYANGVRCLLAGEISNGDVLAGTAEIVPSDMPGRVINRPNRPVQ